MPEDVPLASPSRFELGTDGPAAIVVGVDGSETSLRAASYAAGVARRERTKLIAVYVRQPTSGVAAIADVTGAGAAANLDNQDSIEQSMREAIKRHCAEWDVSVKFSVRYGDPFTELLAVARSERADAIVVGASASLGHKIAGSLAVRLVRHGGFPVTVVP